MEIEIIAFYPDAIQKSKKITGTLHILLKKFGIELRGIRVEITGIKFYFFPPVQRGICKNSGKVCYYPILSFVNYEDRRDLMHSLMTEGKKYILDSLYGKKRG